MFGLSVCLCQFNSLQKARTVAGVQAFWSRKKEEGENTYSVCLTWRGGAGVVKQMEGRPQVEGRVLSAGVLPLPSDHLLQSSWGLSLTSEVLHPGLLGSHSVHTPSSRQSC